MQILLVENKQLYADYLTHTLQAVEPKATIDLVVSIQELKEIEDISDYEYAIVDTGLEDRSALEAIRFLLNEEECPNVIALADIAAKREREILKMICQEKTSVEIAEELFISEHTVLTHRKNLLKKVGAKNTVGLVKYAISHKLLSV